MLPLYLVGRRWPGMRTVYLRAWGGETENPREAWTTNDRNSAARAAADFGGDVVPANATADAIELSLLAMERAARGEAPPVSPIGVGEDAVAPMAPEDAIAPMAPEAIFRVQVDGATNAPPPPVVAPAAELLSGPSS